MTAVAAPSNSYLDLQLPSTFRWRYGRSRSAPVRVPELAPNADRAPRHRRESGREFHRAVAGLIQQPAPGVTERNELRIELAALKTQIPLLRQERDELLATAVSLSAEVSDLRSEIQALRGRKASLEKSMAALRWSTEKIGRRRTGYREFHDS